MLTNRCRRVPSCRDCTNFAIFAMSKTIMEVRLLLITLLSFIVTAFTNVAEAIIPDKQPESLAEIITEYISDDYISTPEQNLILTRQSNLSSLPQTRTISKRTSNQRISSIYTFCVINKPVYNLYIRNYKQENQLFPTGLFKPYRFFISLCTLII